MFREQFDFRPHSLVNFVGGGGKTALIHKLMSEYSAQGSVFCTTTTRIHPPDPREDLALISAGNLNLLKQMLDCVVRNCAANHFKVVMTGSYLSPTLLRGVPPDFYNFVDRSLLPIFLNEADGAASFSLKMPKEGEPVLMNGAEYLVPVLGIDCLHQSVDGGAIFRREEFLKHFPRNARGIITPQLAADILMHPRGICKGWNSGMQIVPFINKVDGPALDTEAKDLARTIMRNGHFPVKRVLFGSVLHGRVESLTTV